MSYFNKAEKRFIKENSDLIESYRFDEFFSKIDSSSEFKVSLYEGLKELEVDIFKNIGKVPKSFFEYNKFLKSIIIEDVFAIEPYAFSKTSLQNVFLLGVKEIGAISFAQNYDLISVVINEGTEIIKDQVFFGCGRLRSLALPVSLKSIGGSCFYGVSDKMEISYAGTVDQWHKIDKPANDYKFKVLCTDGETSYE